MGRLLRIQLLSSQVMSCFAQRHMEHVFLYLDQLCKIDVRASISAISASEVDDLDHAANHVTRASDRPGFAVPALLIVQSALKKRMDRAVDRIHKIVEGGASINQIEVYNVVNGMKETFEALSQCQLDRFEEKEEDDYSFDLFIAEEKVKV